MGLWLALKILGYHPYHVGESIRSGVGHMRALQEAMVAGAADKPLTRDELGRLWGDYDVSLIPYPTLPRYTRRTEARGSRAGR